jgi:hypothetical protein
MIIVFVCTPYLFIPLSFICRVLRKHFFCAYMLSMCYPRHPNTTSRYVLSQSVLWSIGERSVKHRGEWTTRTSKQYSTVKIEHVEHVHAAICFRCIAMVIGYVDLFFRGRLYQDDMRTIFLEIGYLSVMVINPTNINSILREAYVAHKNILYSLLFSTSQYA